MKIIIGLLLYLAAIVKSPFLTKDIHNPKVLSTTVSATPTPTPTFIFAASPTAVATIKPTVTPTPTIKAAATPTPTIKIVLTATAAPTTVIAVTPTPTMAVSNATATPTPTIKIVLTATAAPTTNLVDTPTLEPTSSLNSESGAANDSAGFSPENANANGAEVIDQNAPIDDGQKSATDINVSGPKGSPTPKPKVKKTTPTPKEVASENKIGINEEIEKPNVEGVQFSNENGPSVEVKTSQINNLQELKGEKNLVNLIVDLDDKTVCRTGIIQLSDSGLRFTINSISTVIDKPLYIDKIKHNIAVVNSDKSKTTIVLPDQAANEAKEKTFLTKINEMRLNSQTKYEIHGEGSVKVFGVYHVNVPIVVVVDGQSGKLISSEPMGIYGYLSSILK